MVAGSSPGTSEMASVSIGAGVALRRRPPLMREMCRRTVFISWMSAPHLSSPRVSAVLVARSSPAAGAAHSDDAPPDSSTSTKSRGVEPPTSASAFSAARWLAASGVGWRAGTSSITRGLSAVKASTAACGGVVKPQTRSSAPSLAVVRLGGDRHGRGRLARPDNDQPPVLGRRRKMGGQADVGMRGSDRRLVEGEQGGARVSVARLCRHCCNRP